MDIMLNQIKERKTCDNKFVDLFGNTLYEKKFISYSEVKDWI